MKDVSFLLENPFNDLRVLNIENCKNLDAALFSDIVCSLSNVTELHLNGSNVTQWNLLQIARYCKKLEYVEMQGCQPFQFSSAWTVMGDLPHLRKFYCEIAHADTENRDWRRLINSFSHRIQFGFRMTWDIDYWERIRRSNLDASREHVIED